MEYKSIEESVLEDSLGLEADDTGVVEQKLGVDPKEGAKYVAIVQAVTAIAVILIFLALKYGLPDLFQVVKNWYLDLINKQIPVNYFSEFFKSLFG